MRPGHPGVQRVPTPKLELFILRHFLQVEVCATLIDLIECNRRPSTIADAGDDRYFRTSETCDLPPDNPAVIEVERRLHFVSGINPLYGEPLQGQRYDVGQEFKPHTDYFEPSGEDFYRYCAAAGQRTWTFMVYLNAVLAGGATRFRAIGKTIQPEAGKLLAWNNRLADGRVNPATLHQGMKVRKGVKYVITKWFRQNEWH